MTRVVGRWGFEIPDRLTGQPLNHDDLPPDEVVLEDDGDENEIELLNDALDETDRTPADIEQEIEGIGPPERISERIGLTPSYGFH